MDVHGVVDHVGLGQQLNFRFQDLVVAVKLLVLQKLQQRENEVPVQEWRHTGGEVILRHGDRLWRQRGGKNSGGARSVDDTERERERESTARKDPLCASGGAKASKP